MTQAIAKPWADVPPTGPILRTGDAAAYLGLSTSAYYESVEKGLFPAPLKVGPRASGVPKPWLDSLIFAAAIAARAASAGGIS
jgi:predicted DNA-binding transcriptional regulator AlpA